MINSVAKKNDHQPSKTKAESEHIFHDVIKSSFLHKNAKVLTTFAFELLTFR